MESLKLFGFSFLDRKTVMPKPCRLEVIPSLRKMFDANSDFYSTNMEQELAQTPACGLWILPVSVLTLTICGYSPHAIEARLRFRLPRFTRSDTGRAWVRLFLPSKKIAKCQNPFLRQFCAVLASDSKFNS